MGEISTAERAAAGGRQDVDELLGHRRRGRARALGVLEGVGRGEAGRADHVEGGLEVLLGLARESHDEVGGDGDAGARRGEPAVALEVLLHRVGASHEPEDGVGAGLHRQVQIWHQLRQVPVCFDQVVRHVPRVAGEIGRAHV